MLSTLRHTTLYSSHADVYRLLRNKIKTLMCLYESLLLSHEESALLVIQHQEKKAQDKIWYANIVSSLNLSLANRQPIKTWFASEMEKFNIFYAQDPQLQLEEDFTCVGYVVNFLESTMPRADIRLSAHDRLTELTKNAWSIPQNKLTIGDIIVFKKDELTHIAVYLGEFAGDSYLISKFGSQHSACIHPLHATPENYGEAIFYKNKITHPIIQQRLELARAEITAQLKPRSAMTLRG